jgi:hypothetical protein
MSDSESGDTEWEDTEKRRVRTWAEDMEKRLQFLEASVRAEKRIQRKAIQTLAAQMSLLESKLQVFLSSSEEESEKEEEEEEEDEDDEEDTDESE